MQSDQNPLVETKQAEISPVDSVETDKKAYTTPTVTAHGTVGDITQFVGGGAFDGIIGTSVIVSDRAVKQDFAAVDVRDVLARVLTVPVETWSYQNQEHAVRHIGPMAQDFAAAFGVGDDNRHIHTVDANGVALAAIQGLYGLIRERDQEIELLRAELGEIKRQLAN